MRTPSRGHPSTAMAASNASAKRSGASGVHAEVERGLDQLDLHRPEPAVGRPHQVGAGVEQRLADGRAAASKARCAAASSAGSGRTAVMTPAVLLLHAEVARRGRLEDRVRDAPAEGEDRELALGDDGRHERLRHQRPPRVGRLDLGRAARPARSRNAPEALAPTTGLTTISFGRERLDGIEQAGQVAWGEAVSPDGRDDGHAGRVELAQVGLAEVPADRPQPVQQPAGEASMAASTSRKASGSSW